MPALSYPSEGLRETRWASPGTPSRQRGLGYCCHDGRPDGEPEGALDSLATLGAVASRFPSHMLGLHCQWVSTAQAPRGPSEAPMSSAVGLGHGDWIQQAQSWLGPAACSWKALPVWE